MSPYYQGLVTFRPRRSTGKKMDESQQEKSKSNLTPHPADPVFLNSVLFHTFLLVCLQVSTICLHSLLRLNLSCVDKQLRQICKELCLKASNDSLAEQPVKCSD